MIGKFERLAQDPQSSARTGRLTTKHGAIETPIFMPVGTQATVKGVLPAQLKAAGAQIILGNTYHLHLRPGAELIARMGGLHRFMQWERPILTDSGGYQVFSLASFRQIETHGIHFKSHLDGQKFFLGPREVMQIQAHLGSDIAMVLDECPPAGCPYAEAQQAVDRTIRWAGDCVQAATELGFTEAGGLTFPIVQGSRFPELRQSCASALMELNQPGYAIGGVSVGEPEPEMLKAVEAATAVLPPEKPRYVMGVGTPPQLLQMIARGVDMFDCVMPTREARHGCAFTTQGKLNLKNARFRDDPRPLDPALPHSPANHFSRAYLRHLVISGELLACTLLSWHNLYFYLNLMSEARLHIQTGDFMPWSRKWLKNYTQGVSEASA